MVEEVDLAVDAVASAGHREEGMVAVEVAVTEVAAAMARHLTCLAEEGTEEVAVADSVDVASTHIEPFDACGVRLTITAPFELLRASSCWTLSGAHSHKSLQSWLSRLSPTFKMMGTLGFFVRPRLRVKKLE